MGVLICDGQYGSTGKGLIAGYLAETEHPDTVVTAWGPNAGHTYVDMEGVKYTHCMLANGIVSPALEKVMVGPGTVLNWPGMLAEIGMCRDIFKKVNPRLIIHANAVVLRPEHVAAESGSSSMIGIGSTKKGTGAAAIDKINRDPNKRVVAGQLVNDLRAEAFAYFDKEGIDWDANRISVLNSPEYTSHILRSKNIQIEGAQGFSLGINSGFYPYTTYRECTPVQIMSDCGVPISVVSRIVGSLRTYPIRVSNRYDEFGNMIGYSGPGYPDQREMSWKELNLIPELTTVTKLQRRLFTFSEVQLAHFLAIAEPDEIFLNFCNYLSSNTSELDAMIDLIASVARQLGINTKVKYLGFGPAGTQVFGPEGASQWKR